VEEIQSKVDEFILDSQQIYTSLKQSTILTHTVDSKPMFNANIPLPKLSIPKFGGQIDQWQEFKSLYDSLVHNNASLSPVEKFQYLRSHLTSDAALLIANYQLSGDLYQIAYDSLHERYNNKRRLAQLYVDRILEFSKSSNSSLSSLQLFLNTHTTSVNSFNALDIGDKLDYLLLHMSLRNLDTATRTSFEKQCSSNIIPTFNSLIQFVAEACKAQELMASNYSDSLNKRTKTALFTHREEKRDYKPKSSCQVCHDNHPLFRCSKFHQMDVKARHNVVSSSRLCYRCLGPHLSKSCLSKGSCRECGNINHHSLLHRRDVRSARGLLSESSNVILNSETPVSSNNVQSLSCHLSSKDTHKLVLLGTAKILITDAVGQYQIVRAVLDSGSQTSAITVACAQRLGLKIKRSSFQVIGISSEKANVVGSTQCKISSRYDQRNQFQLSPLVLPTIVQKLPTTHIPTVPNEFANLRLADDEYHVPAVIDVLLGADIYPYLLHNSPCSIISGKPCAVNTIFGYVIMGPVDTSSIAHSMTSLLCVNPSLDVLVKQFWEIEEVTQMVPIKEDDAYVEKHFQDTHYRDEAGRYVVALPFRQNADLTVLDNRRSVTQSFLTLERRLQKNSTLHEAYCLFLKEYFELGHVNIALTRANYLLPHW